LYHFTEKAEINGIVQDSLNRSIIYLLTADIY